MRGGPMGIDTFSYLFSFAFAVLVVGIVALLVGQCLIMSRIGRHIWQGLIPGYNLYLIFCAAGLKLLFLAYLVVAVLTFAFWSMPQPELQDLIWIPIVLGVLMVMYVSLALSKRLRLGVGWQVIAFLFPSYAWVLMGLSRATLDEGFYPAIVRPFARLQRRLFGMPLGLDASEDEEREEGDLADEAFEGEEPVDEEMGEPEAEEPSTCPGYRLRRVHGMEAFAEGEPEGEPEPEPEPEFEPELADMPDERVGSSLGVEGIAAPEAIETEEPAMGNVIEEPERPNEEPELAGNAFDPMDEVEVALVEEDAEEARVEILEETDDEPDPTGYQARHLAQVADRFEAEEAEREDAEKKAYKGKRFAEAVVDFSDDPEDDLGGKPAYKPKHGA